MTHTPKPVPTMKKISDETLAQILGESSEEVSRLHEPFLTVNELARLLQVRPPTLRQWRHRQIGPPFKPYKLGGVWRYPLSNVLSVINTQTEPTSQNGD